MSKYAIPRKPADYTLSEEAATDQVVKLLTYYDINTETFPDEAKVQFERALDTITDHVRRGTLEVMTDPQGRVTVIQNLTNGDKLTYGELGAKHKLAMDRVKQGENYHRLYALMGSLCGLGSGVIEKLPARDLSVVEVLAAVFSNA
jgi:hypothetical protein